MARRLIGRRLTFNFIDTSWAWAYCIKHSLLFNLKKIGVDDHFSWQDCHMVLGDYALLHTLRSRPG